MNTVRITRHLSSPPELVWAALTQPPALMAWFWPQSFATHVITDLRPGGRYRIEASTPTMAVAGRFIEVTAPKRLVFTWRWDGEDAESLVTIELSGMDGGTELLLLHDNLSDGNSCALHAQGWNDCLDRLPMWLSRG